MLKVCTEKALIIFHKIMFCLKKMKPVFYYDTLFDNEAHFNALITVMHGKNLILITVM